MQKGIFCVAVYGKLRGRWPHIAKWLAFNELASGVEMWLCRQEICLYVVRGCRVFVIFAGDKTNVFV